MDIFVTGLLDYARRWKNVEGSFTIGKRSLIVLMAEAWLRSIFDARSPIPYVWAAILKLRHPYIHSLLLHTTVITKFSHSWHKPLLEKLTEEVTVHPGFLLWKIMTWLLMSMCLKHLGLALLLIRTNRRRWLPDAFVQAKSVTQSFALLKLAAWVVPQEFREDNGVMYHHVLIRPHCKFGHASTPTQRSPFSVPFGKDWQKMHQQTGFLLIAGCSWFRVDDWTWSANLWCPWSSPDQHQDKASWRTSALFLAAARQTQEIPLSTVGKTASNRLCLSGRISHGEQCNAF